MLRHMMITFNQAAFKTPDFQAEKNLPASHSTADDSTGYWSVEDSAIARWTRRGWIISKIDHQCLLTGL